MNEDEYTSLMEYTYKNPDKVKMIRFIDGKPSDKESARRLKEYTKKKSIDNENGID